VLFIAGSALTGCNMYAYCNGNPVMYRDPTGMSAGFEVLGLALWLVFTPFDWAIRMMGISDEAAVAQALDDYLTIIYTLYGEAGESADGMIGVAYILNNESKRVGKSVRWVIDDGFTGTETGMDNFSGASLGAMLRAFGLAGIIMAGAGDILLPSIQKYGFTPGHTQNRSSSWMLGTGKYGGKTHFIGETDATSGVLLPGSYYNKNGSINKNCGYYYQIDGIIRIGSNWFFIETRVIWDHYEM